MNDPNWWVVTGLGLDFVGVVLIAVFPYGTEEGCQPRILRSSIFGGYHARMRIYRCGWGLLALGFLLQIVGQF